MHLAQDRDWTTALVTNFRFARFYVRCFYCGHSIHQPTVLPRRSLYSQSKPPFWFGIDRRYFNLIRRLVETYTLEPAGSHGVWGLDDTSFLPFLFGSGQYVDQPSAPPTASIMQPEVIQAQKDKNLYFGAIAWINQVTFAVRFLIDR